MHIPDLHYIRIFVSFVFHKHCNACSVHSLHPIHACIYYNMSLHAIPCKLLNIMCYVHLVKTLDYTFVTVRVINNNMNIFFNILRTMYSVHILILHFEFIHN